MTGTVQISEEPLLESIENPAFSRGTNPANESGESVA